MRRRKEGRKNSNVKKLYKKSMKLFPEIDLKKSVDASEREILAFWERENIFAKSLHARRESPRYTFYDGPPFATGAPHYGHILASTSKDVVPRYWTMRGYFVSRRWGWDTHGLPIENIVEKELGYASKKDIENNIKRFNDSARSMVLRFADLWRDTVSRIGRWVDFDNGYKTMDTEFMESVWWAFSELYKKGLVYTDNRISLFCPRCSTPLSNFEIAMDNSYREVKDPSVYVPVWMKDDPNTCFLVWTTTPWTLPANVALAVGKNIIYCKVKKSSKFSEYSNPRLQEGKSYIFAQDRIRDILDEESYEIEETFTGGDLAGISYTPIFADIEKEKMENAGNGWKVYVADFVAAEEGTGIVHIAPAFGEDDFALHKKENLPVIDIVNDEGRYVSGEWKGRNVWEANIDVLRHLAKEGLMFKKRAITHPYPFCYRCETKLIYKLQPAWYINVQSIKSKMIEENRSIHWQPEHLRDGRFGKGLESAPDWNISRSRYWGNPMPVWHCKKCERKKIVGSVMEIAEQYGGVNRLFLIRHGEAGNNIRRILDSQGDPANCLTEKGKKDIQAVASELCQKGISAIITSPLPRTKETAAILASLLGVAVEEDIRLSETQTPSLDGLPVSALREKYPTIFDQRGENLPEGVETIYAMRDRLQKFLCDINKRYRGASIAIVSHGDPLAVLYRTLKNIPEDAETRTVWFPKKAEMHSLFSKTIDLHRPEIDKVEISCECGGIMKRIPDVFDCWVESGSMPFAELHYPFENEAEFSRRHPAQFISEYIAQTRAWFYVLHVLSVGLFGKKTYENVVTTGTILAEDGTKMSKSKKNYPDPSLVLKRYGADSLRMYLMASPVMAAENLNFSESDVAAFSRGMFRMLKNTYAFFSLYANVDGFCPDAEYLKMDKRNNLLDVWIFSELHLLAKNVHSAMEKYELEKAARCFAPFIDDLSNWYIRRSRKRFWKSENDEDKREAYETLYSVLVEACKLLAPFAPFIADELYRNLVRSHPFFGTEAIPESVHLCEYPQVNKSFIDEKLGEDMRLVREIIRFGLQERSRKGIKVRQPLAELFLGEKYAAFFNECIQENSFWRDLIYQELNVKGVSLKEGLESIDLDVNISSELKREGQAREIVRSVQEMRKQAGYNVEERIVLGYIGMDAVFDQFGEEIIGKETLAVSVEKGDIEDADIKKEIHIDEEKTIITLRRKNRPVA